MVNSRSDALDTGGPRSTFPAVTPGEEVHRLRLTIHYDGTHFHGWQVQATERTVQGEIEAGIERLTNRRSTPARPPRMCAAS